MALVQKDLKISKIKELFTMDLILPSYQRPYSWSVKASNTLFNDTFQAFKNGIKEYRLGSIILHKEEAEKYSIVDGQQRLTTLSILIYCLRYDEKGILKEKYSELSDEKGMLKERYSRLSEGNIIRNFRVLDRRIKELKDDELRDYEEYLLNQCTVVQIVTDSEQEAFQFFDSQNYRGKALSPHDLLKSYHLREMDRESENQKVEIIKQWEEIKQEDLDDLFKIYLYPLTQWYKRKEGLGYSSSKIDSFKGIKEVSFKGIEAASVYNYLTYHTASNLYVEEYANNEWHNLKYLNQFQLTQPLIAGKRFFNYTLHYEKLLGKIQKKLENYLKEDQVPSKRSGDIYIKQLYECSLLFFADRFGLESLTESVMKLLYSWSYSLRLTMYAVYPKTINKYAIGQHKRANYGIDMFSKISEMKNPEELKLLVLERPKIDEKNNNREKYKAVYDLLCEWNGWCKNEG